MIIAANLYSWLAQSSIKPCEVAHCLTQLLILYLVSLYYLMYEVCYYVVMNNLLLVLHRLLIDLPNKLSVKIGLSLLNTTKLLFKGCLVHLLE